MNLEQYKAVVLLKHLSQTAGKQKQKEELQQSLRKLGLPEQKAFLPVPQTDNKLETKIQNVTQKIESYLKQKERERKVHLNRKQELKERVKKLEILLNKLKKNKKASKRKVTLLEKRISELQEAVTGAQTRK